MTDTISAHDNQTDIELSSPPSTVGPSAMHIFNVPLLRATADNLIGFGRPVTNFKDAGCDITPFPLNGWRTAVPGTGIEGGVVEDVFTNERKGLIQYAVNVGLGRKYIIGWYGNDPAAAATTPPNATEETDFILTHEANYHADGGQVFCAREMAPFVLLLAPKGDDITPSSFRAFLIDPKFNGIIGVHVNAGTWHQPAFTLSGEGTLDNRQGKIHSCVAVSFIKEFNGYLRVPLTRSALVD